MKEVEWSAVRGFNPSSVYKTQRLIYDGAECVLVQQGSFVWVCAVVKMNISRLSPKNNNRIRVPTFSC